MGQEAPVQEANPLKETITLVFLPDKVKISHFVFSLGGVLILDTSLGDSVCPFEFLDLKFLIEPLWLSKQWSLHSPVRVMTL